MMDEGEADQLDARACEAEYSAREAMKSLEQAVRDHARTTRKLADVTAERDSALAGWRSVTSRLGFGDGITEPQIGFDDFVKECESRFTDAAEWWESQSWRTDCHLAGHPDDHDCFEHDPTLRLERAEAERDAALARLARVEGALVWWSRRPVRAEDLVRKVRAALSDPEGGNQTSSGNSTQNYAGSSSARQSVGLPGHCERCAQVGHVAAHRNLGCGDVGCNVAHGPEGGA